MFFHLRKAKAAPKKKKRCLTCKLFLTVLVVPAALYGLWRHERHHALDQRQDMGNLDNEDFGYTPQPPTHSPAPTAAQAAAPAEAPSQAAASVPEETADEQPADKNAMPYYGNAATKKFHLPHCMAVDKIGEQEKVAFLNLEEAISSGYVPCKRCNPVP